MDNKEPSVRDLLTYKEIDELFKKIAPDIQESIEENTTVLILEEAMEVVIKCLNDEDGSCRRCRAVSKFEGNMVRCCVGVLKQALSSSRERRADENKL